MRGVCQTSVMLLSASQNRIHQDASWFHLLCTPLDLGHAKCVPKRAATRLVPVPARGYPIQPVDARQPACGRESERDPTGRPTTKQDNLPTLGTAAGRRQDEGSCSTRRRLALDCRESSLSEVDYTSSDATSDDSKQLTCMPLLVDPDRPS